MANGQVHILNGPNLNLLGIRQPEFYGSTTLEDIEASCRARAKDLSLEVVFRQTNHEGALIEQVQVAARESNGVILNAGAYTHTSIGLYDALLACPVDVIEVHLSNIHSREVFRHHSYVAKTARATICGCGAIGYIFALDAHHAWLSEGVVKTRGGS